MPFGEQTGTDGESSHHSVDAQRWLASWREAQQRLEDLAIWCRTVAANLGNLTYEEKRLALTALQIKVKLYPEGHDPRFEITAAIPLNRSLVQTTPPCGCPA